MAALALLMSEEAAALTKTLSPGLYSGGGERRRSMIFANTVFTAVRRSQPHCRRPPASVLWLQEMQQIPKAG